MDLAARKPLNWSIARFLQFFSGGPLEAVGASTRRAQECGLMQQLTMERAELDRAG